MTGQQRQIAYIETAMSHIAAATFALDALDTRHRLWWAHGSLDMDELDAVGEALDVVRQGLAAGRRLAVTQRGDIAR